MLTLICITFGIVIALTIYLEVVSSKPKYNQAKRESFALAITLGSMFALFLIITWFQAVTNDIMGNYEKSSYKICYETSSGPVEYQIYLDLDTNQYFVKHDFLWNIVTPCEKQYIDANVWNTYLEAQSAIIDCIEE